MSLPLLPFLWQQFVFVRHCRRQRLTNTGHRHCCLFFAATICMLGIADGNSLLSLLAKLLAGLGK